MSFPSRRLGRTTGVRTSSDANTEVEDHAFFLRGPRPRARAAPFRGAIRAGHVPPSRHGSRGPRARLRRGPFDLAVVDLMMLDGNGTEVVRRDKALNPATRVAVLSSVEGLPGGLAAGPKKRSIGKGTRCQRYSRPPRAWPRTEAARRRRRRSVKRATLSSASTCPSAPFPQGLGDPSRRAHRHQGHQESRGARQEDVLCYREIDPDEVRLHGL